jgi:hypothetical protein
METWGSMNVVLCDCTYLKKWWEDNIHFVWTHLVWKLYLEKNIWEKNACDLIFFTCYWLLYAIKHFVVVRCLVNQIKTSKKMNDKTTWWNKISNVVKCDLQNLIVSCIFDFVLHSPTLCKNICYSFLCFKS